MAAEPFVNGQNSYTVSLNDTNQLFQGFSLELENYMKMQAPMKCGDRDVQYYLLLQQKRLKNRGLELQYHFDQLDMQKETPKYKRIWQDTHFLNEMNGHDCRLQRSFFHMDKCIYKKEQSVFFYQTITHIREGEDVSKKTYICPNCGSISLIEDLEKGCGYCHTRFQLSELFPKVTNFFFLKNEGGSKKDIDKNLLNSRIICSIPSAIYFIIYLLMAGKNIFYSIILGSLAGCILGFIAGYLLWAVITMLGIFTAEGKAIDFLIDSVGSESKFLRQMREHCAEFSYEYFTGKIVSLLKIIMFSENPDTLTNYTGTQIGNKFENLVDSSFYGMALKKCKVKNNIAVATVNVYIDNWYEKNMHIQKKSEVISMTLQRRVDCKIDYSFSIQKIQCRSCGGSFDAMHVKKCPYCGNLYDVTIDDWVVTSVKKKH